jgi:hypothetical protein
MNSVRGRGGSNGSAASGKRESHEGRSHASSTSQSKLVAHPVGLDGLLGPAARDLAHGTFSSENERQANWTDFSHFSP